MELLKNAIETVEHAITSTKLEMPVETKANLITIVYDIHSKSDSSPVLEHVIRLLRLMK